MRADVVRHGYSYFSGGFGSYSIMQLAQTWACRVWKRQGRCEKKRQTQRNAAKRLGARGARALRCQDTRK